MDLRHSERQNPKKKKKVGDAPLGTLSEQLNPSAILMRGGEEPKLHEWLQTIHLTAVAHAQEKGG